MSQNPNPFAAPMTVATERPEFAWAESQPEAWRKVKLGLLLVYTGICGILLCTIGFPVLMMTVGFNADGPENFVLIGMVMTGAILLLLVLMMIGQLFCLAVPSESGAKALIIATVSLQGLAILVSLLSVSLTTVAIASGVSVATNLMGLAAVVCFILFMRRVALYIQRDDIAARAVRALIVGTVSGLLLIGLAITLAAAPEPVVSFGLVILLPMLGILVALVMYANTVTYLRRAISV